MQIIFFMHAITTRQYSDSSNGHHAPEIRNACVVLGRAYSYTSIKTE